MVLKFFLTLFSLCLLCPSVFSEVENTPPTWFTPPSVQNSNQGTDSQGNNLNQGTLNQESSNQGNLNQGSTNQEGQSNGLSNQGNAMSQGSTNLAGSNQGTLTQGKNIGVPLNANQQETNLHMAQSNGGNSGTGVNTTKLNLAELLKSTTPGNLSNFAPQQDSSKPRDRNSPKRSFGRTGPPAFRNGFPPRKDGATSSDSKSLQRNVFKGRSSGFQDTQNSSPSQNSGNLKAAIPSQPGNEIVITSSNSTESIDKIVQLLQVLSGNVTFKEVKDNATKSPKPRGSDDLLEKENEKLRTDREEKIEHFRQMERDKVSEIIEESKPSDFAKPLPISTSMPEETVPPVTGKPVNDIPPGLDVDLGSDDPVQKVMNNSDLQIELLEKLLMKDVTKGKTENLEKILTRINEDLKGKPGVPIADAKKDTPVEPSPKPTENSSSPVDRVMERGNFEKRSKMRGKKKSFEKTKENDHGSDSIEYSDEKKSLEKNDSSFYDS